MGHGGEETEEIEGAPMMSGSCLRAGQGLLYVDAKGDHDNLAFGSLYRSDRELFNAAYKSNFCPVAILCC